jgi:deoxyribonuclease-4
MARMLPDGRRLGAHLALGDGMVKAADRAAAIGAMALQIFSDNPTAWRRRAAPSPEIPAFRERLAAAGIAPLVIHASYLVNLAGSDPSYHERSVDVLAAELRAARRFGASIVNVHVGSHGGAGIEVGIERLVSAVRRAIDAEIDADPEDAPPEGGEREISAPAAGDPTAPFAPATIVLENSVGSGFGLGTTMDELAAIADALASAGIPDERIGFCLDTAHAWGAGYALSDPVAIDALLDDFDRRIGLGRLHLVHLNDSRSERGSRMDRHEHIGAGRIGEAGLAHVLRHPRLAGATYILETPGMDAGYDAINVARALALARGEPLAPLPLGAFTLRGSRVRAATPVEPHAGAGGAASAEDDDGAASAVDVEGASSPGNAAVPVPRAATPT